MATTTGDERLARTWRDAEPLRLLTGVNHKDIGLRWIITSFALFVLAGGLALTMVLQLSRPGLDVLGPDAYNQFFTMHGTTMMFLFAVPVMLGLGIYFVPLMIGARDVAFPRLNAYAYWVYLFSALALYYSLFTTQAPDVGWFSYVPLAGPEYSPRVNASFYAVSIALLEAANLAAAAILIITIFKMRTPGMSINRMPLFVWTILVASGMIIFAMPPLMVATLMLTMDRIVGTHFFSVETVGNVLLWQHLFWWFGHPEVYIIAIPAFGLVSTIIPTFVRRPLLGYLPVVLSAVLIGVVSFGLWVHHMFAHELSLVGISFFAAASMAIAIPSGVQVFSWIATIWAGLKIIWSTAFLWVLGFLITFTIGGITGVMVASPPFDWQVHDSHFVTAHFHYVLLGGAVMPLMGALYYWFPKITGRMLSETLGRWSFWLAFIGFNVAFFTMHYTGFLGMPRRVHSYLPDAGWGTPMMITFLGALVLGAGFIVSLVNVIISSTSGAVAGDNPWQAGTLEWATTSPPTPADFTAQPVVRSRNPLWEGPPAGVEGWRDHYPLGTEGRETLGTSPLDGIVQQRLVVAGPSIWPFVMAVGTAVSFIGMLVSVLLVPVGLFIGFVAIVAWNWPSRRVVH